MKTGDSNGNDKPYFLLLLFTQKEREILRSIARRNNRTPRMQALQIIQEIIQQEQARNDEAAS